MKWKNYAKSAALAMGNMDIGTMQPFDWLQFGPLFAKEWIDKIRLLKKKCEEQNIPIKELAKLWPTTSSLRCQIYFFILDTRFAKIGKKERIELADFLFEMLKHRAKEDIFGFKSNITKTKQGAIALLKKIKPEKANPKIARLLGKIYNSAYQYACGMYLDFYADYPLENEGPYDVSELFGENTILVIKKFKLLKPTEIWPESEKAPANQVIIYAVYKDVEYRNDLVSVHSVYKGDIINNLIAYAVKVDDVFVYSQDYLEKLNKDFEKIALEQWSTLTNLDIELQKQKGLFIRCFGMKDLFEKVGMDWKPEKEMVEAVKKKPLFDNTFWKLPKDKDEQHKYWLKTLNPELEFNR